MAVCAPQDVESTHLVMAARSGDDFAVARMSFESQTTLAVSSTCRSQRRHPSQRRAAVRVWSSRWWSFSRRSPAHCMDAKTTEAERR